MRELITELANLYGTSGREESVASFIREELEKTSDSVKTDKLGNVIAKREGTGDYSIMLAAHMDEIGLAVEKVDEENFAYPSRIGGWDPRILPAKPMKSEKGWGMVSTSPPELLDENKKDKSVKHHDLFIEGHDLNPGDFLVQDSEVAELGNKNTLVGKSFDDRAGVAILIETFRRLSGEVEADIYGVGTVQEEVGLRGAKVSAYGINPDIGLVLETTPADDFPTNQSHTPIIELGKGPAITVKDASLIASQPLNKFLIQRAKKENIPYQISLLEHGGTDAGRIHLTKTGVPSTNISVPTRYLHSPIEVLDLRDLKNTLDLVVSSLSNLEHLQL